ncbi:MAG: hypothetical protein K8I82_05900, partial [Anaerolineae bacterium]|nr:hypothetical protein [Anaerolineae bacterium]
ADDNALMEYVTDVGDYYFKLLKTPGFVVQPHTLGDAHHDLNAHTIALNTLAAYPLIWHIHIPDALSESDQAWVNSTLARTHDRCESWDDGPLRIDLYAHLPFGCDLLDAKASDQPLVDYPALNSGLMDIQTASIASGQMSVAIAWSVPESIPYHTYSVSLKVYDAENAFMAQTDFELPRGAIGWQLTAFDIADWSAGTYEIRVTVYDWQTGERVEGHLAESDSKDTEIAVRRVALPLDAMN